MRILFLYFVLTCSTAALFANEAAIDQAVSSGDYKNAINIFFNQPTDKQSLAQLAELYYLDQDEKKAYETFLKAIDISIISEESPPSANEQAIYNEAFKIYIDPQNLSYQEAAQQILENYGTVYKQHPDYDMLGYLIALSFANFGAYQKFFPVFYKSYQHYSNNFLVDKTKAILNIKLYEQASIPEAKEQYRLKIQQHINDAIKKYPHDTNLYKMAIVFSSPVDKQSIVNQSLEKIIQDNIQVPRHEIIFYVGNAVEVKSNSLAQQFIDKAKIWYPYSRAINAAQCYLDQKK